MKKLSFIIFALIFAASGIYAQNADTHKINKKQKVQLHKIKEGVKSGELTRKEEKRLLKQEAKLQKKKKIAKADGKLTPGERRKLHREARKLDAKIYKQKHDRQKQK
jgi:hypothetical protein